MPNEALYLYGIVKNAYDIDWAMQGIDRKPVFTVTEGGLSAMVHELGEKPDLPTDVVKVKEQIIAHNEVLSKAMEDFGGVAPLKFGTVIVSKNGKSASDNLKEWLKEGATIRRRGLAAAARRRAAAAGKRKLARGAGGGLRGRGVVDK